MNNYPVLPEKEQRSLFEEFARTKSLEVRDKLFNHNQRLVPPILSRYLSPRDNMYMDALQEGGVGLLEAISRYDIEEGGGSFASFAHMWIAGGILRFLNNNRRTVRIKIPYEKQKRFLEAREQVLAEGGGVYAERTRISERVGVSEKSVMIMDQMLGSKDVNYDDFIEEFTLRERRSLLNIFPDMVAAPSFGEDGFDPIFRSRLEDFGRGLQPRDWEIFKFRFLDDPPLSQRETVDAIGGITRMVVRDAEQRAFSELERYFSPFVP